MSPLPIHTVRQSTPAQFRESCSSIFRKIEPIAETANSGGLDS